MTWQLSITGLLIGLLVGMTGMGGGALLTPFLILFFNFKPTLAVGTDILHGAVFKTFGAVRHRRLGTVHARLTFWMFLGSAPFSLLGVQLAEWIQRRYEDGVEYATSVSFSPPPPDSSLTPPQAATASARRTNGRSFLMAGTPRSALWRLPAG